MEKRPQRTIITRGLRWDIFNIGYLNDPCHQINLQQRATAPDIDVNRLVSKGSLAKANSFTQQLQRSAPSQFSGVGLLIFGVQGYICTTERPTEHGEITHRLSQRRCAGDFSFAFFLYVTNQLYSSCNVHIRRAGQIQRTSMWRWAE